MEVYIRTRVVAGNQRESGVHVYFLKVEKRGDDPH